MTGVHGMKTQNVLKKFAIGFGVLAVDDYMCAIDHGCDTVLFVVFASISDFPANTEQTWF